MLNSLTRHQGVSETDPADDVDPDFPSHQEVVPRPGSLASTNVATLGDADIDAPSEDGREETGKQQQEEEEIEIDEQKEAENADSEGGATTGQVMCHASSKGFLAADKKCISGSCRSR